MKLPKQECPGCDVTFAPFFDGQIYCQTCRGSGDNVYDDAYGDDGELKEELE